jgi:hypothetical protein
VTLRVSRVRQLFRVEKVRDGVVTLIIPGWSSDRALDVSRTVLPSEWRVIKGLRFFGVVNLAAETAAELLPGPPFEQGGQAVRTRLTEGKLSAALQAAPRSKISPKAPVRQSLTPTQKVVQVLVKALGEYQRANRLHHDRDAKLHAQGKRALKAAERWSGR